MWFDLQFTLYTVCCLTFQLHSQNYIVATSVIEQLTLSILTKIQLKCRFSLLFSFTVSITLLYVSHWPQLRVCHYKVFQLSIQYAHWVLMILHHLIQTRPRKLIFENKFQLLWEGSESNTPSPKDNRFTVCPATSTV